MKASERVAAMKAAGLRVLVCHTRPVRGYAEEFAKHELQALNEEERKINIELGLDEREDFVEFLPQGGTTYVSILRGDLELGSGKSVCSRRDNFCRRAGLELALERAELAAWRGMAGSPMNLAQIRALAEADGDRIGF